MSLTSAKMEIINPEEQKANNNMAYRPILYPYLNLLHHRISDKLFIVWINIGTCLKICIHGQIKYKE